jgi:hypothetical protein
MSGHDTHDDVGADLRARRAGRWAERWRGLSPAARAARIAGFVVLGIIGAAVFALAFGWLVMILWNWLMPVIFHLGEIGYWQAFGIVILAKLIFGGMRGPRGPGRHHGNPWKGNPWKGNPWGGHHGSGDWNRFQDFWQTEGRAAFDAFAERKRAEQGSGGPGGPTGTGTV